MSIDLQLDRIIACRYLPRDVIDTDAVCRITGPSRTYY